MFTRRCELEGCGVEFQTDHPTKKHCTTRHSTLSRVRRYKAKNRKGGGGGGGGNGGGSGPTLFDEIVPVDSRANYVPSTCYRTPAERRPPEHVTDKPARAFRKAA